MTRVTFQFLQGSFLLLFPQMSNFYQMCSTVMLPRHSNLQSSKSKISRQLVLVALKNIFEVDIVLQVQLKEKQTKQSIKKKIKKIIENSFTSVVIVILPEVSIQKITIDSSRPELPQAVVERAGSTRQVTSSAVGFSSSSISTVLRFPQNSHFQI